MPPRLLAFAVVIDRLAQLYGEPAPPAVTAAKKDLQKFPAIDEPAAEKIVLFNHRHPFLALDSNGLRVLVRLGYAPEHRNYAATYKGIQRALAPDLPDDCGTLIRAHQLLRQHGQELCKRNSARCDSCLLRAHCLYFREVSAFQSQARSSRG